MKAIGSIALHFTLGQDCPLERHDARSVLLDCLIEAACPGSAGADREISLRAGPGLSTRSGYGGLILCASRPEAYDLLLYAAARSLTTPTVTPWGLLKTVHILSEPGRHPFLRRIFLGKIRPAPLRETVSLRSHSPVVAPFDLLGDLRQAQDELAQLLGETGLRPQEELSPWVFRRITLRRTGNAPETCSVKVELMSSHPYAAPILDYAILRGFGADRSLGQGCLDLDRPPRRNDP